MLLGLRVYAVQYSMSVSIEGGVHCQLALLGVGSLPVLPFAVMLI